LIDDDEAILDSLGQFLTRRGFIVRTWRSATEYVKSGAMDGQGDCILADIRMPGMSGMDLQRWLNKEKMPLPLMLMTGFADIDVAVAAMKAGAYDFFEKPVDERRLVGSLQQAAQHLDRTLAERQEADELARRLATLSERERDVMGLLTRGRTNREIGLELGISGRTAEVHRAAVMEKTQSATLADLIRMAIKLELAHKQRAN
jgi:two-component system response regulator FixJ